MKMPILTFLSEKLSPDLSPEIQSNLRRAITQGKMQKWLLFAGGCFFAGSVMRALSQSYVYSIPMCYKPNIYNFTGFFITFTSKST